MTQLLSRYGPLAVLAALAVGPGASRAGPLGPDGFGYGDYGVGYFEGPPVPGFNRAWMYPYGGYTLYPGEPGSCFPSHSDYAKLNWVVPPTVNAQGVLDRLHALGVPLVQPETIYLGRNPRAAEGVKLPLPRGWQFKDADKPREVEPPVPGKKGPEKLEKKPKAEDL